MGNARGLCIEGMLERLTVGAICLGGWFPGNDLPNLRFSLPSERPFFVS